MAKKLAELQAGLSLAPQARAEAKALSMLAKMPFNRDFCRNIGTAKGGRSHGRQPIRFVRSDTAQMTEVARDMFGLRALPVVVTPKSFPIELVWPARREADPAHAFIRKQIGLAARAVVARGLGRMSVVASSDVKRKSARQLATPGATQPALEPAPRKCKDRGNNRRAEPP